MPRNGLGTYQLPAGNPVITGTPISSTTQNTTMTDVANALTTSICTDGQTPMAANLPMAGFRLTGLGSMVSLGDSARYEDVVAAGQIQTFTAFTTAGAAPAFTLTPNPAIVGYVAMQRFNVTFNAAGILGSNTIAVSGLAAKNLKQYNEQGIKQAAYIPLNFNTDIEYDGTDFVVINPVLHLLRNRLINGGMGIDQRNGGATQTFTAAAALAYAVDRWYGYCTGANVTGQRIAGSGTSQYRYQFTGAASVSAIGFGQRIETANSFDLNTSTAMLSVDLANSLLTTVTWTLYYANSTDTFGTLASPTRTQIATGTFTVNSTVTRYSTAVAIPAGATTGLELVLSVGAQTSGTWVIGAAQIDPISNVFETRNRSVELALCQPYLPVFNGTASDIVGSGLIATTSAGNIFIPFLAEARVPPTGILIGTISAFSLFAIASSVVTSISLGQVGKKGSLLNITGTASPYTVGQAALLLTNTATGAQILFTGCEL